MNNQPFSPGVTTRIAAGTGSLSTTLTASAQTVRVRNAGPNEATIRFSVGSSTALVTDMPIPVGDIEIFSKGVADTASAICATGTADIAFTCGEGM